MYYRIYQLNSAIYPGWGFNLNFLELNQMALWWLDSLYTSEVISEEEFKQKQNLLSDNVQEDSLIEIIQDIGKYDGGLEVEKSEEAFDLSELSAGEELERPWN